MIKPMPGKRIFLSIDGWVDILLGTLLGIFPGTLIRFLGAPPSNTFYISILGAVLFGIGLASLIEREKGRDGLGISGAIAINLCGGIALVLWLLFGHLSLNTTGYVSLWLLAIIIFGLGLAELTQRRTNKKH